MRAQYLRCDTSLLLFAVAICLSATPCRASQSDKSPPEKSSALESKYYLDKLQFDSIKLELAGHSPFPLEADRPFTLRAASSSGAVLIKLISGAQSGAEGIASLIFTPQHQGQFVFEARVVRSNGPAAEPGVRLTIEVAGKDDPPPFPACAHLLPSAVELGLDAGSIVKLLGAPTPFTLVPQGNNAIIIYSTRERLSRAELALLHRLEAEARELRRTPPEQLGMASKSANAPFAVELAIPHAAALGDLASRIDSLHYAPFNVTLVGTGKVRIKSDSTPSCEVWKAFLADVHDLLWQLQPQPFSASLFYLTAADVTAALNATNLSQPASGATPARSAPPASPATGSPAAGSATKATGAPSENAGSGSDPAAKPSDKAGPSSGSPSSAESASPSTSAQKSSVAFAHCFRIAWSSATPIPEMTASSPRRAASLPLSISPAPK